jgi:glycosyltransferase involved in cell wall biosynthesis
MKIGVLIDRLNIGGVEKIAIEQVHALRAIGEEAYLVVLRRKAVVNEVFPDLLKDLPIIYLDDRLPKFLKFSFQLPLFHFFSSFHLSYPVFIPFVVKKKEFEYFIVHGTYTSLSAISIKVMKKIKFSSFIWDPASYIIDRVYRNSTSGIVAKILKSTATLLDKFLINQMDVVLVGGDAHNAFIHQVNPTKKIEIIYPSVHPIKKILPKNEYVLLVTAWKRGKHPEYVLDIVEQIPSIKIKMVGKWIDPQYKLEFESKIKKKGFSSQIEIVGEVSETELADYYSRARVVLQTNDDRGFGLPALEAAGNGTTYIIPQGQGVCELFKEGQDGYYTKEKDTKSIVLLLNTLLSDKELASRLGRSGWKKVNENYSWERHAQLLQKIIKEVMAVKIAGKKI